MLHSHFISVRTFSSLAGIIVCFLFLTNFSKAEPISIDNFKQIDGWSAWSASGELPSIELVFDKEGRNKKVGLMKFPYESGTKTLRKSVKDLPPEGDVITFWAKCNQWSGSIRIGVRTRDLTIYSAKLPFIDETWKQYEIPLFELKPSSTSESVTLHPEDIVLLMFSVWNPERINSGQQAPLEIYLDQIEFSSK